MRRRRKGSDWRELIADDYRREGAAASIQKTIAELKDILAGEEVEIRGKLRTKLHNLIEDLAVKWFVKGWRRGVKSVRKRVLHVPPIRTIVSITRPGRPHGLKRKVRQKAL